MMVNHASDGTKTVGIVIEDEQVEPEATIYF